VIVIGDGGNWAVGVPAIAASLRGLAAVNLELSVLESAVHSGQFGGVVPDALISLGRLIASLHNDDGSVAVEGIASFDTEGIDYPDAQARFETGVLGGVQLIGTGSVASRLWTKPAVAVLAIDAPSTDQAINQLVPYTRAKVSLRVPPGQGAEEALQLLKDHLVAHAPWGTKVRFLHEESGEAFLFDQDNAAMSAWREAFNEAYGTETVMMGSGGSIPFIATFSELYPDAPIIVIGCGDPTSSIHAPNESQDLGDVEKATLSEAIAFRILANH
jgi:acetylornithine deacetylase/succinyl-diaminopimelate desuccinylase-like protein